GFLDYARHDTLGLVNQGWKDSRDSIFHADGRFPAGPIALVEVQGYVYAAKCAMGDMAEQRGDHASAVYWRAAAQSLRTAVERHCWMPDRHFYAIALDGEGRPCQVRASNAGHLLYTGLAAPERAHRVIEQLLMPDFNSRWGIRTLARGE